MQQQHWQTISSNSGNGRYKVVELSLVSLTSIIVELIVTSVVKSVCQCYYCQCFNATIASNCHDFLLFLVSNGHLVAANAAAVCQCCPCCQCLHVTVISSCHYCLFLSLYFYNCQCATEATRALQSTYPARSAPPYAAAMQS